MLFIFYYLLKEEDYFLIIATYFNEVITVFTKETNAYLELLSTSGTHSNLHRFRDLLEILDNPQEKLKCIHLAGTNGKGSVASFISAILQEAGYKIGLYTSPDLVSVTERIRIGDILISEKDFERLLFQVREAASKFQNKSLFTYFEVLTAIAFLYYKENNCDVVVLETGLGGRHDATNIITAPLCAVLTTISYDHIQRLGSTLKEIAYEKAGIIKPSIPTISYPQEPEVLDVITSTCQMQNAPLYFCDLKELTFINNTLEGQVFNYKNYQKLSIQLLGKHQCYNAALAIEVIELLLYLGFTIRSEAIYKGLAKAKWPGRLDIIHYKPLFLIDGAHNFQGALALRDAITYYFKGKKIIYLFGSLKDKDYHQVLELTMPLGQIAILVTPPSTRAIRADLLQKQIQNYCPQVFAAATLKEGTELALSLADEESVIIAFVSLYFIGELPKILETCL